MCATPESSGMWLKSAERFRRWDSPLPPEIAFHVASLLTLPPPVIYADSRIGVEVCASFSNNSRRIQASLLASEF